MSLVQERSAEAPRVLWGHLALALLLSTFVHNLGAVYLGLPAPNEKTAWQWQSGGLVFLGLVPAIVFAAAGGHFLLLGLIIAAWLVSGASTGFHNMWLALRNPSDIRIRSAGRYALLYPLFLIVLFFALLGTTQLRDLTVFQAPAKTLVTEDQELLIGFKYEPFETNTGTINSRHNIRLQRGQLVLARIDDEPVLVRILAISGDTIAQSPGRLRINASSIRLFRPIDGRFALEGLIESIAFPRAPGDAANDGDDAAEETMTVGFREFIVTRDEDLMSNVAGDLPLKRLFDLDIIAIPSARLWSLTDKPGKRSSLVQPSLVFVD